MERRVNGYGDCASAGSERILLLAPSGRDSEIAVSTIRAAGMSACACDSMEALCSELGDTTQDPVGAVVLTEESLSFGGHHDLVEVLRRQPPWSDLPVVLLSAPSTDLAESRLADLLEALGNVSLIERPMQKVTLVTAVQVAVRQRRRQYVMRDLLDEQRRAVELRDHFLAMLGHELRNPLSAIVLANELVESDSHDRFDDYRRVVERQARNLNRIVNDILDVSRMTRGRLHLEKVPVDLREIVAAAMESDRRAMEKKGLNVVEEISADPLPVSGDPTRLEQIFHNLLQNAIKFTPPGGRVELRVERAHSTALVRISDTGEGIPADKLREVFALFSQPTESTERHRGGLGLGLALVDQLVRLHRGSIVAHSGGPGMGASFELRFPLLEAAPEAALRRREAAPAPPKPKEQEPQRPGAQEVVSEEPRPKPETTAEALPRRAAAGGTPELVVLLVEDDDDNREMLSMVLRRRGMKVRAAANGEQAIASMREIVPDVCLVDIGLPDIDGYAVGRRARALFGEAVLLVALTGFGHAEAKQMTKEAGFDIHLTKPVDLSRLRSLLEAGVKRGQTKRETGPQPSP